MSRICATAQDPALDSLSSSRPMAAKNSATFWCHFAEAAITTQEDGVVVAHDDTGNELVVGVFAEGR